MAKRPEIDLKVYFAMLPGPREQGVGFGVEFEWDIPVLDGYAWECLPNGRRQPSLSSFVGSTTPTIGAVLRDRRPDALVVTGWNALPLVQALWAGIRLGIPRIVRGESNSLKPRLPVVSAAHRVLLRRYDAFLAIGRANREFYLRNGVPQARLYDCPYFVDNAQFGDAANRLRESREKIREAWNIPSNAVCFLFAGKLQPKKAIFDLLRAMRILKRMDQKLHLLVVGSGEQLQAARRLVAQEGIPATFAGFLNQSDMPKAYAAADCLVLPSDYGETWGLVVNEAMASGVPAIVSDRVGCGPDLIMEGRTGYLFPFGEPAVLAERMKAVAADHASRIAMGNLALEHIGRYSVDQAVRSTIAAIEGVVAARR